MTNNILSIWRNADAVCFDVDSTVIENEAIDELASFCGKLNDVQAITKSAMSGQLNFRDALSQRLAIISPKMDQIRDFVMSHKLKLTKNIKELVHLLHEKGTPVYLISGGFRGVITPLALELNIPLENIYANKLKFFMNGDYAGFDENELTSKSGGKGEVIQLLKDKYKYNRVVMIGDGITDADACPPADAFIGFGGNVVREEVKQRSRWFITDFQELINALA